MKVTHQREQIKELREFRKVRVSPKPGTKLTRLRGLSIGEVKMEVR